MKKTVTMFKGSIFRNIFSILTVLILIMTVFNLTMTLFIRNRLFKDKMQEQNVYIDSYASFMDDTFQSLQNIFTYLQRNDAISWRASSGYRESDNYLKNEQAIFDLLSTFSFTSTSISEILVYWEDTPYLYTAQGLVQKDVYFHNRFKGNYAEWVDLLESHYNQVTIRIADSAVHQYGVLRNLSIAINQNRQSDLQGNPLHSAKRNICPKHLSGPAICEGTPNLCTGQRHQHRGGKHGRRAQRYTVWLELERHP